MRKGKLHQFITDEEINNHIAKKKEDSLYPRLPKMILKQEALVPSNTWKIISTLSGFKRRVHNYENALKKQTVGLTETV